MAEACVVPCDGNIVVDVVVTRDGVVSRVPRVGVLPFTGFVADGSSVTRGIHFCFSSKEGYHTVITNDGIFSRTDYFCFYNYPTS